MGGVVWNAVVVVLLKCSCVLDRRLCVIGCVTVILDPLSVVLCKNDISRFKNDICNRTKITPHPQVYLCP